ncbi:MAG: hypothetical protein ABIP21_10870 [Acidimicrobiia bacterium]
MRTPSTVARILAVGAVAAVGTVVPLSVAGATTYPSGGTPPEVIPAEIGNPASGSSTTVAGKTAARATLPFTGTDAVELSAIAGASAGIGIVMVRRSRRRAAV